MSLFAIVKLSTTIPTPPLVVPINWILRYVVGVKANPNKAYYIFIGENRLPFFKNCVRRDYDGTCGWYTGWIKKVFGKILYNFKKIFIQ